MNDLLLYTVLGRDTLAALDCPRVELILDHEPLPPTAWTGWAVAVHAHERLPGWPKHIRDGRAYANLASSDDDLYCRSLEMARRSLQAAVDVNARVRRGPAASYQSPGNHPPAANRRSGPGPREPGCRRTAANTLVAP